MQEKTICFPKLYFPQKMISPLLRLTGAAALAMLVGALCSAPAFAKGAAYTAQAVPSQSNAQQESVSPSADMGLVIVGVDPAGPAAQAGIARGDILLTTGDVPVDSTATLYGLVTSHKVGDQVVLVVKHGDETRSIAVTLGERGGRPYLGVETLDSPSVMTVQAPQAVAAIPAVPALSEPVTTTVVTATAVASANVATVAPGLIVANVMDGGPAAIAGISVGDLISAIDGQPIRSFEDVVNALQGHTPGEVATLRVQKGGPVGEGIMDLPVTLGAAPDDPSRAYLGISFIPTVAGVTVEAVPATGAYTAPAIPLAPPLPVPPDMLYNYAAPTYAVPTAGQACGTTIQQYFYAPVAGAPAFSTEAVPALPPLPAIPGVPVFIYQSGVNAEAYPYAVPYATQHATPYGVPGQAQGDVVVYNAQPGMPGYPGTVVYGATPNIPVQKPGTITIRRVAAGQEGDVIVGKSDVAPGVAGGNEVMKVAPTARKFVIIQGAPEDKATKAQAVPVPVAPAGDGWY